jgi:GxxExxY protein
MKIIATNTRIRKGGCEMDENMIYKDESYLIIGKCMEVYNELGHGFLEIVYKDALEIVFQQNKVQYEREKEYQVCFRNLVLQHKFYADFVVGNKIILEIKSVTALNDAHIAQTINYLRVSDNKLGLLVNFGKEKLDFRRVVL